MFYRNFIDRTINTRFNERIRRRKPYLKRERMFEEPLTHLKEKFSIGEDRYFDKAPLPNLYYTNEVVLMPKNKTTIFAYWEVREDDYENLKLEKNIFDTVTMLLYKKDNLYRKIQGLSRFGSYYINNIRSNREYKAVIGFENEKGEFFEIAKSNKVISPSGKVSHIRGTRWGIPYMLGNKIKLNVYTRDNLPDDYILSQEITDRELVYESLTDEKYGIGSSENMGSSDNNLGSSNNNK
ncbi:DUF4912 domain-containing protein [Oceanivirga salmonicida]|uniref:DUF4912 domain-containing protein n=1 Tax=Oceanivirga salmonicida TaxID=1769291 RepID=UPI00082EA37B|nr:DUF4912 domain-containing protein [Oceanivirga salmonicida]